MSRPITPEDLARAIVGRLEPELAQALRSMYQIGRDAAKAEASTTDDARHQSMFLSDENLMGGGE